MNEDCGVEMASPSTVKHRALKLGCCMWAPIIPPIAAIEVGLKAEGMKESEEAANSPMATTAQRTGGRGPR